MKELEEIWPAIPENLKKEVFLFPFRLKNRVMSKGENEL